MPFESPDGARFEDFEDCVDTISGDGTSREDAKEICGKWQSDTKEEGNQIEFVDLS